MAATADQAITAKQRLRQEIGRPEWLLGVGVGKEGDDHVIEIRISRDSPEIRDSVPAVVDSVRVCIVVVGDVRAD